MLRDRVKENPVGTVGTVSMQYNSATYTKRNLPRQARRQYFEARELEVMISSLD